MIPTLVGVAILTFVVMRLVPGDIVALRYAGASVPQEVLDRERALLGLDKPMWAQFLDWMSQLARLDLGQSLWTGHSIVDEVWTRLPLSIELAIIATAMAVVFALPLGVLAAVRQDSWVDYAIRIFSVGGLAMPSFWIGIMLVLTTITLWGWAPCALVYAALPIALVSGSAASGALAMAAFGLGTVPALLGAGWLLRGLGERSRRWAGVLLMALAVVALLGHAGGDGFFCVS